MWVTVALGKTIPGSSEGSRKGSYVWGKGWSRREEQETWRLGQEGGDGRDPDQEQNSSGHSLTSGGQ